MPPRAGRSGVRPRCEPFPQAGHVLQAEPEQAGYSVPRWSSRRLRSAGPLGCRLPGRVRGLDERYGPRRRARCHPLCGRERGRPARVSIAADQFRLIRQALQCRPRDSGIAVGTSPPAGRHHTGTAPPQRGDPAVRAAVPRRGERSGTELAGGVVPPAFDVELHPGHIRGRSDLVGDPVRVPRPGMRRVVGERVRVIAQLDTDRGKRGPDLVQAVCDQRAAAAPPRPPPGHPYRCPAGPGPHRLPARPPSPSAGPPARTWSPCARRQAGGAGRRGAEAGC